MPITAAMPIEMNPTLRATLGSVDHLGEDVHPVAGSAEEVLSAGGPLDTEGVGGPVFPSRVRSSTGGSCGRGSPSHFF